MPEYIISLNPDLPIPEYIEVRAEIAGGIITANIETADIPKLADDPAVVTYEPSRRIWNIG